MNHDLLLQRMLDGTLTPAEHAEINRRLLDHAALREHLRDVAEQAVAMGDFARAAAARVVVAPPKKRTRLAWAMPLALAAALALLASAASFWMRGRAALIVTVTETTGTVIWSRGGESREGLQPGDRLAAGTLETTGDTATAQFRFGDGTLVTLAGDAQLALADGGQKQLALRRGSLSADVQPQPAGRPMIVRTPSAEVEVLGTHFGLTAGDEVTSLTVGKGHVKMRRLADDDTVEVSANQRATATLESNAPLVAQAFADVPTQWHYPMQTPPPQAWRGSWRAGTAAEPPRIEARPYVAGRKRSGDPIVFHGISFNPVPDEALGFVRLGASSVLTIRFRLTKVVPLQIFLCTRDSGGSFAGNFNSAAIKATGPAGQWQELMVPLHKLWPLTPNRSRSPAGLIGCKTIVHTASAEAGLELAEIRIEQQ